jgi:hypothetical protein
VAAGASLGPLGQLLCGSTSYRNNVSRPTGQFLSATRLTSKKNVPVPMSQSQCPVPCPVPSPVSRPQSRVPSPVPCPVPSPSVPSPVPVSRPQSRCPVPIPVSRPSPGVPSPRVPSQSRCPVPVPVSRCPVPVPVSRCPVPIPVSRPQSRCPARTRCTKTAHPAQQPRSCLLPRAPKIHCPHCSISIEPNVLRPCKQLEK